MATTDTRSGFRLPWSSDRSHEPTAESHDDVPADGTAAEMSDGSETSPAATGGAWPEVDVNASQGQVDRTSDPAASTTESHSPKEPAAMVDTYSASSTAPAAASRRPSRLIAELAAAMRATAETAREQALAQVEADVRQVIEAIRTHSTEGAAELRKRSDDDIASIRDWSKTEIARIREETDQRISARKTALEAEIAGHAAAIDRRVEEVQGIVSSYETDMAEFFERLLQEEDPARLATMAESMPEPPSLADWADLDDLDIEPLVAVTSTAEAAFDSATEPEAPTAPAWADEAGSTEAVTEAVDDVSGAPAIEAGDAWAGATWSSDDGAVVEAGQAAVEDGWPVDAGDDVISSADGSGADASGDTTGAADMSMDREAIMAALEAAAEAVVAAEAAAESADQAEAAADVAETAAELIVGRVDTDDESELGSDAEAAFAARLDAGGFDDSPSLADRLASLVPGGDVAGTDPVTTQVVVTGLVSVASIASFKRHLGRIAGVQAVSVASGPDGEFVFNVTHRSDVSFRDVVPTLPGFAARVTGSGEGVVNVAARDPETEG